MAEDADENSRLIVPVHQSVSKLLSTQQTFEAPRYQRNYAWDGHEISAFLSDLDICVRRRLADQAGRHHFFGGLVTVKAPVADSTRVNLQVVDGQQRLATFAMLISRLKRLLVETAAALGEGDELKPVLQTRARTLNSSYEFYPDEIRLKNVDVPRVSLSAPDQPFFAALLAGEPGEPIRKSHALLKEADRRIGEYLHELIADCGDGASRAERLQAVHDVLKADWTIIHMAATARDDAYMLFQVLNDRGVTLTEGELLRSTTLEALEKAAELPIIEEVEDLWNDMLGQKTNVVSNAFGWLYASQLGSWPSRGTMLDDYVAAFFPSMPSDGTMDEAAMRGLVSEIRSLSAEFHRVQELIRGEWPAALTQGSSAWDRNRLRLLTKHLRYVDCISLLVAACNLKTKKFVELVLLLERFAFRYAVISEGPVDRARAVMNRHAVEIRRDPDTYRVGELRADLADLIDAFAGDGEFKSAIEQMRYSHGENGNGSLKYLLLTLEDYTAWYDENSQGAAPVCRDKMRLLDFETGTIEHVYAQNVDDADPTLDAFVDTLGNVTLLSGPENDQAANKKFPDKRPIFAKSTSTMNRRIAEHEEWTVEAVETRAAKLTEMAVRIFRI
ncbi:MAG TPA: DUF262 domain-containing HNH endonuclease family protein [Sphingomonadaceae bacterium]|nr:DUF262 domain-containing HNH endonuclease family protein [Sphingomonadaceae bacterium]